MKISPRLNAAVIKDAYWDLYREGEREDVRETVMRLIEVEIDEIEFDIHEELAEMRV